jgi:hypothetical protein
MNMAKGYWIVRVDVNDIEQYKRYMAANAAPFKKFSARFLVRGGKHETVEGPCSLAELGVLPVSEILPVRWSQRGAERHRQRVYQVSDGACRAARRQEARHGAWLEASSANTGREGINETDVTVAGCSCLGRRRHSAIHGPHRP